MLGLLLLKLIGFSVTVKHAYLMAGWCLLWSFVNAIWFIYAWIKTRKMKHLDSNSRHGNT